MSDVSLTINGEKVSRSVEPRTSMAELLRERLNLTGTHLGCEQGVCGACTIVIDGVPVRSCITNAMACDGAEVRTIEDFDEDPVTIELRRAFNRFHALQCGFCTPGMLVMARDIVMRMGDTDESRIRVELAGNLCRCTGYAGIVKAIRSVIESRRDVASGSQGVRPLGPAGSGHSASPREVALADANTARAAAPLVAAATPKPGNMPAGTARKPGPAVKQSFSVAAPPETVWERFGRVPSMVRCIPGASLVSEDPDGSYQIKMRVKMGPIGADFAGVAHQHRDPATMTGVISGAGRDTKSASLAEGELVYRLGGEDGGTSTRVDIEVSYQLSGALAQFARAGIVTHFIGAITKQFADNLGRSLQSGDAESMSDRPNELRIAGSFFGALRSWLREMIRAAFRK